MIDIDNICLVCEHFCLNNHDENLMCGCRAFPEGIPQTVHEPHSHDRVITGQIGDFVYKKSEQKKNVYGQPVKISQK
jgi:hypothetical protein